MSKRYIFPDSCGERKKPRLDVSVSDHNFPLSQNFQQKDFNQAETWGDENDDEILLLASQACEQAYDSMLPDYSICMQPASTSTQIYDQAGTSKEFQFKKPTQNFASLISTQLKDRCDRISSPLPGLSKVAPRNDQINLTDDLIVNEKIFKDQDSDYVYKQLLQLQEENAKLKSENGKLLEKCVTKEGEASILRTQLKSCQVAVDSARLERIKAQEKMQLEWTEKLNNVNKQVHDLRTQLDFKNVEIISAKERCKMLESSKVKLTQVTVPAHDISSSQRHNSTFQVNETLKQAKKVKTTTSSAQTDDKAKLLKLNCVLGSEPLKIALMLPYILEPTFKQHSILDYNEKLQQDTEYTHNKCKLFSTFHRIPNTPTVLKKVANSLSMDCVYEDLTAIAMGVGGREKIFNVFKTVRIVLDELECQLETISERMTTAFQKQMDEKYIETTNIYDVISDEDLVKGGVLYKEEQAILARRMIALLSTILECPSNYHMFVEYEENCGKEARESKQLLDVLCKILRLVDNNSCAVFYSGFILSSVILAKNLTNHHTFQKKIIEIIKHVITSRPMLFVQRHLADVMRKLTLIDRFQLIFCTRNNCGNLKTDYDQGVMLYRKESCFVQVFLRQIEISLKCIETQQLSEDAVNITECLIIFYININNSINSSQTERHKCDCLKLLLQVIVYALRICAIIMKNMPSDSDVDDSPLLPICLSGIHLLHQCSLRDVEFTSQLMYNEGHLIEFCECMRRFTHSEAYGNMLSELTSTFQSSPEDTTSCYQQAWLNSFDKFHIAD